MYRFSRFNKFFIYSFLLILFIFGIVGCSNKESSKSKVDTGDISITANNEIKEDGYYYSKEDVVKYLQKYSKLPPNYITKSEAKKLGWDAKQGNLWEVTDKFVIGGDVFGNREGKLPKQKGKKYYEADVNYRGGRRNSERIIFTKDGEIYYTSDHYNTFEKVK